MGELIKDITSSAPLLAVTVVIVIVATVTLLAVFVVAFAQGRSIAFWPPSIGERPKPASVLTEVPSPQAGTTSKPAASVRGAESWPPVAGSVFTTSSGAQYVMEDRLSVGGVSVIYRAAALNNREQPVVIKALWIGPEPDAEILRAFSNEARATARLKHPNIAAPYDSGAAGGDFGSIIGQILSGAPDIRKRKSSVSHELAERIGLALHSDPQQRPVSATAILAGIERDLLVLH